MWVAGMVMEYDERALAVVCREHVLADVAYRFARYAAGGDYLADGGNGARRRLGKASSK